ncbi:unnamed protein product, partial [Mesorhabditis belari]|uniref:Uncharacterized protein n=1 Tax=Mesorhabditis belari TaxID=2138241 RepID=A0AAF3EPN0_9BILA
MAAPGSLKMKINLRALESSPTNAISILEDDYKESEEPDERGNNQPAETKIELPGEDQPSPDQEASTSYDNEAEKDDADESKAEAVKSADTAAPQLLSISLKTHKDNARKRKRIGNLEEMEAMLSNDFRTAQEREKERLERQSKRQNEMDYITQMALLVSSESLPLIQTIADEDFFDEPEQSEEKKLKMEPSEHEIVTLSSDDEDDIVELGERIAQRPPAIGQAYTSYGRPISLSNRGRWGSHHEEVAQQNLRQQREFEKKRLRKRRNSGDLESKELTEGKLLINSGRPDGDPPLYVAPHLTHTLQPHQLAGIRFMFDNVIDSVSEFKKSDGFGCILAHSMGLGKTIQVITFSELFFRATETRKILVVVPINTIQNWYAEYQKWMPEYNEDGEPIRKFQVFLLGDAIKGIEQRTKMIEDWHRDGGVLLIGYEMFRLILNSTKPKKEKKSKMKLNSSTSSLQSVKESQDDETKENLGDDGKTAGPLNEAIRTALLDPGPDLVVCDEGHKIKNLNTVTASALNEIRTKRRIVLTGTPLQNNLIEYFCMVDFVRPAYLGTKKSFIQMFEKPIKNGQCTDSTPADQKLARQRTHVLTESLRGFVQRRTHSLLKEILPECREYVLYLRKSPIQHALYKAFILYAQQEIDTGNTGTFNPLKAFAACSKIWNHPDVLYSWLQRRKELDAKVEADKKAELDAIQKKKQQKLITQWMHPPNDFTNTQTFGNQFGQNFNPQPPPYDFSNQSAYPGSSSSFMNPSPPTTMHQMPGFPQQSMNDFGGGYRQFMNMPTTTSGYASPMAPSSITSVTFPISMPQSSPFDSIGPPSIQSTSSASNYGYSQEIPPNSVNSRMAEPQLPNIDELDQIWANMGTSRDDFNQNSVPPIEQQLASSVNLSPGNVAGQMPAKASEKKTRGGRGGGKPQTLLSALQEELDMDVGLKYDWAEIAMSRYERGTLDNGYKLVVAMGLINEATKRDEKILLFSQNLTTLDVLEDYLSKSKVQTSDGLNDSWQRNVNYFRFDGTTAGVEREKLITRFNGDPAIRLFIISTRAGSLGINLVSANRCIIFDACWNPCHDAQAVCRVYRYGQKRRTYIYRLVMDNSMERAIFNRQISKSGLAQRVVDDVQVDSNLTQKELETLLVYEEALDLHVDHQNVAEWEIEDEVLKTVVDQNTIAFAGKPILHESLMLESEEKLSEEEKREAQLLFEKEKNRETTSDYFANDYRMNQMPPMGMGGAMGYSSNFNGMDPLRSAPLPQNVRFNYMRQGIGGATMASLPSPSYLSLQKPYQRPYGTMRNENFPVYYNQGNSNDAGSSRFNPSLQSMNPFSQPHRRDLMNRLELLRAAKKIGEPEIKDDDKAILQRIILEQDMRLRICQLDDQYDDLPRGTELTLVLNPAGTFAKDTRTTDGKVYNCRNTALDLGFYREPPNSQMMPMRGPSVNLPSSNGYNIQAPRTHDQPLRFFNPLKGKLLQPANFVGMPQLQINSLSSNSGSMDECIELD